MSPLTFAIGDIHGCLDKLRRLIEACEAHAAGRPARYVFLGDYIDRGPNSRGVVEFLMRRQQAQPGTVVCLRGNHEQLAIDAHEDERAMPLWLQNSGGQHATQLLADQWPHIGHASRLAARIAVLPRRRAALLRTCRHRSDRAAGPAVGAGDAVDARAVPHRLRPRGLRPLHRARPHSDAHRHARSPPSPPQPRHRRRDRRPAHRRRVRRQPRRADDVLDRSQRPAGLAGDDDGMGRSAAVAREPKSSSRGCSGTRGARRARAPMGAVRSRRQGPLQQLHARRSGDPNCTATRACCASARGDDRAGRVGGFRPYPVQMLRAGLHRNPRASSMRTNRGRPPCPRVPSLDFSGEAHVMNTIERDLLAVIGKRRFATILADPPWQFTNKTGKVAPEHKRLARYGTMTLAEIMALPVGAARCAAGAPLSLVSERDAARGVGGDEGVGLHLQVQPGLAQGAQGRRLGRPRRRLLFPQRHRARSCSACAARTRAPWRPGGGR